MAQGYIGLPLVTGLILSTPGDRVKVSWALNLMGRLVCEGLAAHSLFILTSNNPNRRCSSWGVASYQFSVAPVIQYKVLWFEVSVDDAFGMQVGEGLHHTSCIKPGGRVLEWTSVNTAGKERTTENRLGKDAGKQRLHVGRQLQIIRISHVRKWSLPVSKNGPQLPS